MKTTILEQIVEFKRQEVAEIKRNVPLSAVRGLAEYSVNSLRPFEASLRQRIAVGNSAVIAEIKKVSPSRGLIRPNFNPEHLAQTYALAGAACLSVLTETRFFQGSSQDLICARQACALPVLRKDFLLDPYQVYESRAMGADCVLLIAACLDDHTLKDFEDIALDLGMSVLIEVHDSYELERALKCRTKLLGINNRDLRTFDISLRTTLDLLSQVPQDRLLVTESGISSAASVKCMREAGVHAFLVGEALLHFKDPGEGFRTLFDNPAT